MGPALKGASPKRALEAGPARVVSDPGDRSLCRIDQTRSGLAIVGSDIHAKVASQVERAAGAMGVPTNHPQKPPAMLLQELSHSPIPKVSAEEGINGWRRLIQALAWRHAKQGFERRSMHNGKDRPGSGFNKACPQL